MAFLGLAPVFVHLQKLQDNKEKDLSMNSCQFQVKYWALCINVLSLEHHLKKKHNNDIHRLLKSSVAPTMDFKIHQVNVIAEV
jgi:hypothetical protein